MYVWYEISHETDITSEKKCKENNTCLNRYFNNSEKKFMTFHRNNGSVYIYLIVILNLFQDFPIIRN